MDTLIQAASLVSGRFPGLSVAIAGSGRDRRRLERLASHANVRVDFLGRLSAADLPDFYACSDVFALCCRSRWWGLEQEGFGIVLIEAASTGVPCVTIDSGGAAEAVKTARPVWSSVRGRTMTTSPMVTTIKGPGWQR